MLAGPNSVKTTSSNEVGASSRNGIKAYSLTDQIDTTTPADRFNFHVMATLAQMERELTIERTQAGLSARAKSRRPGRKRILTESKITSAKKVFACGTPPADVAKDLGVSVPTLYRWVPARQQWGSPNR